MEHIRLLLDDGTGADFDRLLAGTLPEGCDMTFCTKNLGTEAGNPCFIVHFSVQLPDGTIARAQSVNTLANLANVFRVLRARYPKVFA